MQSIFHQAPLSVLWLPLHFPISLSLRPPLAVAYKLSASAVADSGISWSPRRPISSFAFDSSRQSRATLPRVSGTKEKLSGGDQDGNLPHPEKKHPLDDLCLDVRSVLLRHEPVRQVQFLFTESNFQTFRDSTSFGRLDLGRFEDRKYFCRAHKITSYPRSVAMSNHQLAVGRMLVAVCRMRPLSPGSLTSDL